MGGISASGISRLLCWPGAPPAWQGSWQLCKAAPAIDRGLSVELAGMVTAVDGRLGDRLRVCLAVSHASMGEDRLHHHLVRLSVRPRELIPLVGSHVSLSARNYPPPPPVLHGARDHGMQALIRGVDASGYLTAVHSVALPDLAAAPFPIRLSALRQARADRIAAGMTDPAGGDRRRLSDRGQSLCQHRDLLPVGASASSSHFRALYGASLFRGDRLSAGCDGAVAGSGKPGSCVYIRRPCRHRCRACLFAFVRAVGQRHPRLRDGYADPGRLACGPARPDASQCRARRRGDPAGESLCAVQRGISAVLRRHHGTCHLV